MPRNRETMSKMIPVQTEALVWLAVLANIDLALRHPKNDGASARVCEHFADELRKKLLGEGILSKEEYTASVLGNAPYRKNPVPQ